MNGADEYVCIECGRNTPVLYKDYSSSLLKLWQCERCGRCVDKYIEYDHSLVFMDIVLQKIPAIRHILYNSEFKKFWKLSIVCLLCNAYTQWSHFKNEQHQDELLFEVEFTFYYMCACAVAGLGIHIFVVIILTHVMLWLKPTTVHAVSTRKLFDGLLFADFGQLFGIPAAIWGQSTSQVYTILTTKLIILSNVQMHRAVCCSSRLKSWTIIILGFAARLIVMHLLCIA